MTAPDYDWNDMAAGARESVVQSADVLAQAQTEFQEVLDKTENRVERRGLLTLIREKP
jgi:hypothetical protein